MMIDSQAVQNYNHSPWVLAPCRLSLLHALSLPQAEVRDIGIFADPPPSWLRDDEKESVRQSKGATVRDKLNWEAFLDELGMKPLSPCTSHRKVAGTVLTLGWTEFSHFPLWRCMFSLDLTSEPRISQYYRTKHITIISIRIRSMYIYIYMHGTPR